MKKHACWILFMAISGCTLSDAPDVSEYCPEAQYYTSADGTEHIAFGDSSNAYNTIFSSTKYCPSAYPVCGKNDEGSFCHELCRDDEVFCDVSCIRGQSDDNYCGARGKCVDDDLNSEDYRGQRCDEFQRCIDGQCVCARDEDVACGDSCIDPLQDMNFCGAKGLCSDAEPESENYRGKTCDRTQRCMDGQCVCVREWDVVCGDTCVDPLYDIAHCGAKGLCTNDREDSSDYKGRACKEGQKCDKGICTCTKEWELLCGDACIDPQTNASHCGALGTCSNEAPESTDYAGGDCMEAAGGRCRAGKCLCPEGYHPHDNGTACEMDDEVNCGAHGHACQISDFKHASKVACQKGACAVTACEAGSFLDADGQSCVTCSELVVGVKKGDSIYLGHYRQLAEDETKYPVEWQVLANNDNGVVVISKYVLDVIVLNNRDNEVNWKTCTLRSWLNGLGKDDNTEGIDYTNDNFISIAFNEEEAKCLQAVNNSTYPIGNTNDRVYLLDLCETGAVDKATLTNICRPGTLYMETDEQRIAYATAYAMSKKVHIGTRYVENKGYYTSLHFSAQWWLRSPGKMNSGAGSKAAKFIQSDGSTNETAVAPVAATYVPPGLRPAMTLLK